MEYTDSINVINLAKEGVVAMSDNWDLFDRYANEFLKQNEIYELAVKTYMKYLKKHGLSEKVLDIKGSVLDEYIEYLNIGYEQTLITYISALKKLYEYLLTKHLPLHDLYGYINTTEFKEKHKAGLEKGKKKNCIEYEPLIELLEKIDEYLEEKLPFYIKGTNKRKRILNVLIARMFIKTSLLLPLKTSEIISKKYLFINDRCFIYNDIAIKMPNGYRKQLLETIDYIEREYGLKYIENQQIFQFFYSALEKEASPPTISNTLVVTYNELEMFEMLVQKEGNGRKSAYVYQPESFKMTAISNMLQNGANIFYIKRLTGLDIKSLFDCFEANDIKNEIKSKEIKEVNSKESNSINQSIILTDYYSYL